MKKSFPDNLKMRSPIPMVPLFLLCFFASSVLCSALYAQTRKSVTGTVTEVDTGMPIVGANIIEKGTSNGVMSDFDGNFKIDISPEAIIEVSVIGFVKQSIKVKNQSKIDVGMETETTGLDEVVIVGYGTQKKGNLTGSVSIVSSEALVDRPVTNAIQALQGTAPGLNITKTSGQPGNENQNIEIRGVTSANGSVPPLLVMDGASMSDLSALQRLNPDDIESVSVLKDAAAASIYGARAAGGVILVTTKTGKKGKMRINYDGRLTVQYPLNVPQRLSLLEEAEYSNLARTNSGSGLEYTDFDLENIRNGVEFVVDPNDPNKYLTYNQKSIRDQVLRNQYLMTSHNLNASGGTEKIKYLFSVGYFDQEGVFKFGPDNYKRWNMRSNVSAEMTKHITFDSKISYASEAKDSPSGSGLFQQVNHARLRYPTFLPDGRLYGGAGSSTNTVYSELTKGGYEDENFGELNGNFTLTAKDFIEGVKLTTVYGRQINRRDFTSFSRTVELWDLDESKPAYYLNRPNSYARSTRERTTENFQFLIDYDLRIAEKHKFHALAGYQWEDYRSSSFNASVSNLVSNDLPTLELAEEGSQKVGEGLVEYANQSFLGRLNYDYDGKYLIEATFRSDESSRLAPGQRVKMFYSASAGWNMHKETWFQDVLPFLSEFKPRFSWGQLGNANGNIIGYYDYLPLISNNNNMVFGESEDRANYFYQGAIPSASLGWETVETTNYGLDFGILKNKITGEFNYYTKTNDNMLVQIRRPGTLGIGAPRTNGGKLEAWGWEAALNYKNYIGDLNFSVGFNISDSQNKLVEYGEGYDIIGEGTNSKIEGYSLNTIWGYETVPGYIGTQEQLDAAPFHNNKTGIGDIQYVDQNGDGKINTAGGTIQDHGDLINLGSTEQRYIYGFTANANWRNLNFSFFLQGVGKRNILPSNIMTQPLVQSWQQPITIHQDYYTPENPDAAFPRPYLNGGHNFKASDRWVLNAAYLRVKNIQVGYTIPEGILDKTSLAKVRLYLSAENILTFSKLGVFGGVLDPEQRNNVNSDYPLTGSVALGVNISF